MEEEARDAWEARFHRERAARREAERLLQEKSRELYASNQQLTRSLTDLVTARETLVERETLAGIGAMVATVSHEIATPLGVAVTACSLIDESVRDLDRAFSEGSLTRSRMRELLAGLERSSEILRRNVDRAARLVDSFKRVSADQQADLRRIVDLGGFLQDISTSLSPLLRRSGVSLEWELASGDGRAHLSAGPLTQVLTNLIQNAVVHAFPESTRGEDRRIRILVEDSGAELILRVRDNGQGIPEELQGRVLEPFFTTRQGSGGTGLGLHIVREIVEQAFSGRMILESNPGAGTCWILTLPWGSRALMRAE